MDRSDCYKCELTPSDECGECPVWLTDEEVTQKERDAYQQGRAEVINEFAKKIKEELRYYQLSEENIDEIAEQLKEQTE